MDEYVFRLTALAIIFGSGIIIAIAVMITNAIRSRTQSPERGAGNSLTQAELRQLLSEVVAQATDPLYAKMNALERRLDQADHQLAPPERPQPRQLEARIKEKEALL